MMTRGQTQLGLVIGFGGVIATALAGWNGWNTFQTVALIKEQAPIIKEQDILQKEHEQYIQQMEKLNDRVTALSIDSAINKEIIKLIGDRYQIDSTAIEARIHREQENLATTTLAQ